MRQGARDARLGEPAPLQFDVRTGHRVTGNPRDSVVGAGWEFLFVAIDDHARIAFTQMCLRTTADERQGRALHPIGFARMGLWHPLRSFLGAYRHA